MSGETTPHPPTLKFPFLLLMFWSFRLFLRLPVWNIYKRDSLSHIFCSLPENLHRGGAECQAHTQSPESRPAASEAGGAQKAASRSGTWLKMNLSWCHLRILSWIIVAEAAFLFSLASWYHTGCSVWLSCCGTELSCVSYLGKCLDSDLQGSDSALSCLLPWGCLDVLPCFCSALSFYCLS